MRPSAATLEVNLSALKANYRLLKQKHAAHVISAVVKANAYGLGVAGVSKTLWEEGCRDFFVATLDEAIELRAILPEANIGVFNGMFAGEEKEYAAHALLPVINTLEQLNRVSRLPYIIHVDTGITRLGLSASDMASVTQWPAGCVLVMSHLASSYDSSHPKNAEQLARFKEALNYFPGIKTSLSNSSGIFLPPEYHFDMGRPGCALYGINPANSAHGIVSVTTLSAPILQLRVLDRDEAVGYGSTYAAKKGSRIAIAGLGYSDGYFRSLGNGGHAYIEGYKVPLAGRVSMDMIAVDVSSVPEAVVKDTSRIEFINDKQTVGDIAAQCNTIGYEVLTRIGRRVQRLYR